VRTDLPSGTVTFLFTDVEGSTKLLHELGAEGYAAALAEHRRAVREACARHEGVEVDTQGDAFFFAFPSAPGALTAADEMTDALASGQIQVRIGLHTGTPLLTEEGYIGDDVHFGARVAASSHGGQVVLSSATAKAVELPLTDLGEHRLKDIAEPVSIFQLGDGSFPPLKTISNTNLPRPASSFVGRDEELREVLSRIEAGARLLTLTGPGGTGKTRLALEAAASLVPDYKAGVFWIGLAAVRDPALVTETIAQTLGAKDGLADHIAEREMLLLLDNLEQVVDAAPELSSLLSSCPDLTLLVTSRELLRVQGEVECAVPPLAEPDAVTLFCERAQLEPSDEIAELCARLDNLPLAVELAAARTKALSPAQILERLAQRLDLLKGGRDADPRQQTLRATIEWSYDLLSEEEQRLFSRLSVFAGGCTLEAAEEVAGADLDTLQSLVEKSLVRFTNERYWLLETIREFALEQIARIKSEHDELGERHFAYLLRLAESHGDELWDAKHEDAMRFYEQEYPNLRAALSWARDIGRGPSFLRLASAMSDFWRASDYLREGRDWLEQALTIDTGDRMSERASALSNASGIASLLGDLSAAEIRAEQALELYREAGDLSGCALSMSRLANVLVERGENDRARGLYDDALDLARAAGDERTTALALTNVGALALEEGRVEAAEAAFGESRERFRSLGNKRGLAVSLGSLGEAALARQQRDEAAAFLKESAQLYRELGTKVWTAPLLESVAQLERERRDPERAVRLLAAARRLREETGSRLSVREQLAHEGVLASLAEELGERRTATLVEEGEAMSMSEALDYALTGLD
jgi:predicted ATPase